MCLLKLAPMKKYICILASAALLAACEQKTEKVEPMRTPLNKTPASALNPAAGAAESPAATTESPATTTESPGETTESPAGAEESPPQTPPGS
jgi:hypothetical protein